MPLYLEDELFYFLLGISCLHTRDLGGSEFYFKRSLQVNNENIESRLYLAAVNLKKKDQANAARLWLNVLDLEPDNRLARKGLETLKKIKSTSELEEYITSNKFYKLTPKMKGFHPLLKQFMIIMTLIVVVAAGSFALYPYIKVDKNIREQAVNLSLDNYIGPLINMDGNFVFQMTGDEIKSLFKSAVEDFHNFDDNSLQMKINKIKMSNASDELKSKISLLENLIEQPNMVTLKTNFNYRQVAENPLLYRNCYVLWTGRITNISYEEDKIKLDLLVGYEEEKILEGIVSVEIPFETSLNESVPMEILGQIRNLGGKIVLTAVSVRSIIK
ncbi:tetratricopeptide repeat protein [Spirochaeta isovalerica]|uniref:Tetratricopeptide repeat protein n=1 Tax=Spirochaeta isovalerica TaxID=150 RepID=A0A841R6X9_9SPIO|nr:hypothetical protein [Spirochaeta isovalerica]MBB6478800.1 hypothetical protein [Spirochaeta isovalerica]